MILAARFIAVLLLLASTPALAWAPEGHQIVAGIAARELTPKARTQVGALLGGEASAMMVLESNWADEIRQQRPESVAWHYLNIELGSRGYVASRDCRNSDCVVAQIDRDAAILSDPRAAKPARTEALLFLIHFVADVHQPLHAADRNDKGGNGLMVQLRGKRLSLHQVWDQDVVAALGEDPVHEGLQFATPGGDDRQIAELFHGLGDLLVEVAHLIDRRDGHKRHSRDEDEARSGEHGRGRVSTRPSRAPLERIDQRIQRHRNQSRERSGRQRAGD